MVAYIVDEWITLSQTFIRNEVAELRRQGVHVEVVALGPGDAEAGADDRPRTCLTSFHGRCRDGCARSLPTPATRRDRGGPSDDPSGTGAIPPRSAMAACLRSSHVSWVHAHFGWEAAACAEVLAAVLGTGWSFTAHAKDIYVDNTFLAGRLTRADRLVTVCRYNLDQMAMAYGALPPSEIVVCGVEVPPIGRRDDLVVDVLAVGRLVPKKGFDVLVDAAAALRSRCPDLQVEIVGDGPEASALAERIDAADLGGTVHLLGARSHEWTLARMEQARLAVLPARIAADGDRDSMPVVLKEAMARAVPVVATDVAAIPEMVDHVVGRLVPTDDPAALADAMAELLGDPASRPRWAWPARACEPAVHAGRRGRAPALVLRALAPGDPSLTATT